MSTELLTKQILKMDVKSDEFFELYKAVSDKYWTFENPDTFQLCAATLVSWAQRGDEQQVTASVKIIEALFMMEKNGTKATMGHVAFKDGKDYYFTLATSKENIEELEELMAKVLKGKFKMKEKK